jgi:hypothetical protein
MVIFKILFPALSKEHSVPIEETHHSHWPASGSIFLLPLLGLSNHLPWNIIYNQIIFSTYTL